MMTKLTSVKGISLALGCAELLFTSNSVHAANISINAETTWNIDPTDDPNVLTHAVDGIVQVSLLGNCTFHADVFLRVSAGPGQPNTLKGTFTFTSADGMTNAQCGCHWHGNA